MIGRVHEISVPVEAGPDYGLIIDGKLCLEMLGQAVSRSVYSAYADALGVDDNADIFNVPNRSGRFTIGEQAGTEGRELLNLGGAETVVIDVQNMPAHNHALFASSRQAHVASAEGNVLAASVIDRSSGLAVAPGYTTSEWFVPAQMHAGSVSDVGGGQPISVMPPFIVSRFFVQVEA